MQSLVLLTGNGLLFRFMSKYVFLEKLCQLPFECKFVLLQPKLCSLLFECKVVVLQPKFVMCGIYCSQHSDKLETLMQCLSCLRNLKEMISGHT